MKTRKLEEIEKKQNKKIKQFEKAVTDIHTILRALDVRITVLEVEAREKRKSEGLIKTDNLPQIEGIK